MPKIENCSRRQILDGTHKLDSNGSILISIVDPDHEYIIPKFDNFKEIYRFKFWDFDVNCPEEKRSELFNSEMAKQIINILMANFNNNINIIIHCSAGICRSGAITEIGSIIGFDPVHNNRMPNLLVKRLLMEQLNLIMY